MELFDNKKFVLRLKEAVQADKQETIASKAGCSQSQVSKYLRGAVEPPIAFVFFVSQEYNASTDYLLGIEDGTTHQATADLDALGLDEECLNIILQAKGTEDARKIAFMLKNKDIIFDLIERWEK